MAYRADHKDIRKLDRQIQFAGGKLMIFGRPTLMWEDAPTPENYLKELFGYTDVHSIDVSDYEGATYVHDLNDPLLPAELIGQYDVVSTGGTAEHVFAIGTVLRKSAELLKVGGTVMFAAPANNWLDHGFYQVCPTLKFDFFQQNGFDLRYSEATLHLPARSTLRRVFPLYPGEAQTLNFVSARVSHTLFATKTPTSTCDRVPTQSVYLKKHNDTRVLWRFNASEPFDNDAGELKAVPKRWFELDSKSFQYRDGRWLHRFQSSDLPPSMPGRPFRSKALVYEDGKLLDWIVSDPGMVADRPGSFIHAGGFIHLTASDGSDPRRNGRRYALAFPQPFVGLKPFQPEPLYSVTPPDYAIPRTI